MRHAFHIALLAASLAPGAVAAAEVFVPPPAKEGYSYPECKCSNRGEMLPLGALACLHVDGQSFLARCELSLNNPMWRKVQDGCPSADLGSDPTLERL